MTVTSFNRPDLHPDMPLVLFPQQLKAPYFAELAAACRRAGFVPKVAQRVGQPYTMLSLVAQEMGIAVPDELSVVAGDDSQLCYLVRPALTALARDIQAYGVHTARILMEVIDGRSPASQPEGPTRLVVRASTARPPA